LTIKGKDVKVGAPGDKFNRIVPIKQVPNFDDKLLVSGDKFRIFYAHGN